LSAGGGGGQAEGDLELNIAPIVDCFTVLIAYLLVSMSFISLGILEAGVAATGPAPETPAESTPPEIPLTFSIQLAEGNRIELKLTGGKMNLNQTITLDPRDGATDLDGLKTRVAELKQQYPDITDANISADPGIRYKAITKAIEAVKPTLPKVFLADS
jgi:biopolymer transport protein ExbD